MKIQKAKRLNLTDFPDAPEWVGQLFQVLNTQFERWVTLFENNITFEDNLRTEKVVLDFTHDVVLPVRLQVLKSNPEGAIILGTNYFEYPRMTWEMSDDTLTVNVKIKWDVPPDEEVRVTLLFIGS